MISRFYLPRPWVNTHDTFTLPEDIFRHAITVLRMRINDNFVIFDGEGCQANACITQIDKKTAQAVLLEASPLSVESPLNITLAQCLSSADKMDWTVEKAVELGVSRIVPLFSARSQIKLSPERAAKKREHWQRIIVAACAQCGRNVLPDISMPISLNNFLGSEKNTDHYKLMLHPRDAHPFKKLPQPAIQQNIIVLIGPESGFDENEFKNAQTAQFTPTLLGPRILRTESAGLAVIGALQAIWGDF